MHRFSVLFLLPSAVLAHPGHGAIEIHWHFDDLVWLAIVFAFIVFLIRKTLKR